VVSITSRPPIVSTTPPSNRRTSGWWSACQRVSSQKTNPTTIIGPPNRTKPRLPLTERTRERVNALLPRDPAAPDEAVRAAQLRSHRDSGARRAAQPRTIGKPERDQTDHKKSSTNT